ncbi:hypothetical protein AAEX37_00062 [Oligella sp. MSHR50489EDL]|uniref:hypothetical protein n=1 Tax=Oligella sp. MSHR50489EDL TaxID=3139409 RepID=UPI003D81271E
MIALNALFTYVIFPGMDFSSINQAFAAIDPAKKPGIWAIITLLSICGLNHRQSYMDIAAVTIFGPLVALTSVIVLGSMFGSF